MVFQSFGLLYLSAVENVELPLRVNGTPLDEARERASGVERLDLADRIDNRTFELSAGQQQRVAVARALITEPRSCSPTSRSPVDTENADLILAALWDVIGGGAVLAATHNPEALRYANRVVLFRDGVVERKALPTSSPGSSRRTSLIQTTASGSSEPEGLPDVVASIDDGVGIELDRQRPLSGLAPQHAVEHRAPTAGSRQRRGHAIAPRLDAALQVEVSGGVPDRGSTDVHGQPSRVRACAGRRRGRRARRRVGGRLRRDEAERAAHVALPVETGGSHHAVGVEQERAERPVLDRARTTVRSQVAATPAICT